MQKSSDLIVAYYVIGKNGTAALLYYDGDFAQDIEEVGSAHPEDVICTIPMTQGVYRWSGYRYTSRGYDEQYDDVELRGDWAKIDPADIDWTRVVADDSA